jgi:predicted acyl esterase
MRWASLWVVLAVAPSSAQTPEEVKANTEFLLANYTKFEYCVPMRDGVKLFTVLYAPKDVSKTYPMLLLRTPYGVGPYGPTRSRLGCSPPRCSGRPATSSSTKTSAGG